MCAKCGHPLCDEHKKKGISLRTNNPIILCPGCQESTSHTLRNTIIGLSIGLIIILIILVYYLSTLFPLGF
ncbi:MAG: hypothetical protein GF317_08420 [Candidatus Lokiarchaeota archaeon]|nr:hypothetical protein [Candidatus Lokiarchaeota archaeon]MBD3199736.1 hypothetical protein [Candidatus Lokiarchaeota archaeon]